MRPILALLSFLAIAGTAHAQPTPPSPGIAQVNHDSSLTGNGKTTTPLGVRLAVGGGLDDAGGSSPLGLMSCPSGQLPASNGTAYVCTANGGPNGISGTLTPGIVPVAIAAHAIGNGDIFDDTTNHALGIGTTTPSTSFALDIERTTTGQNGILLHTHATPSPNETPQIVFSTDQGTAGARSIASFFNSTGQYYTAGFMVISGALRASLNETTGAFTVSNFGFPTSEPAMLVVSSDVGGPTIIDKGSNDAGSYLFEGLDGSNNVRLKIENTGHLKWGATTLAAVDVGISRVAAGVAEVDTGTPGTLAIWRTADPVGTTDVVTLGYLNSHNGVTSVATGTGLTGGTITGTGTLSLAINGGSTQNCSLHQAVISLTGVGLIGCSTFVDAAGSGLSQSGSTLSLPTQAGVTPGSYSVATVTVNAQGIVTGVAAGTAGVSGSGTSGTLPVWSSSGSQSDSLVAQASGVVTVTGGLTVTGAERNTGTQTTTTLGNNFSLNATTSTLYVTVSGLTLTGIAGGVQGRVLRIINEAAAANDFITVANDSSSSSAGNRIYGPDTAPFYIDNQTGVWLIYDADHWRVIGNGGQHFFQVQSQNDATFATDVFVGGNVRNDPSKGFKWGPVHYYDAPDLGIGRNAAGVAEINNGTLHTLADLTLRNFSASGTSAVTGAATFGSTLAVTGAVNLNGNTTIGDATSDTLTLTAKISGHVHYTGGTPTYSCAGATVNGNDERGWIDTPDLNCTLTFASSFGHRVSCTANGSNGSPIYVAVDVASDGSTATFVMPGKPSRMYWHCDDIL